MSGIQQRAHRELKMKPNSIEHRLCRRSELSQFMGARLDDLIREEERQAVARMAARAIHWQVMKVRVSAGDISGRK